MTVQSATIIQRLWNYCTVLRDDGVSYGDYVEQLTYLLFLKMGQEQAAWGLRESALPEAYNWASLRDLERAELENHYREICSSWARARASSRSSFARPRTASRTRPSCAA